ncbi:DMT family transporter [Candidatus Puniceispirillum sp.]|uniref:DMT family transporter n=1 Tax=Candidatus Puniceispirillum sp. TaxID=2026719 RepID=UPI003F6A3D84
MSEQKRNVALLILLALVWSSSFSAIKLAVVETGPLTLVGLRTLIGFFVVLLFIQFQADFAWRPYLRHLPYLFIMSVVGMSLPFYLISDAELVLDSSLTGLLMSVGPLLTIIGAHFFAEDERVTVSKVIGVLIGLSGVVILFGHAAINAGGAYIIPQIMVCCATGCYVAAALMARRLPQVPALFIALVIMGFVTIQMLPLAFIFEQPLAWQSWSSDAWLAILWLGALPTGFAFFLRYHLIKRAGAGFTSFIGYLIPVFSVFLGALLLGETLGLDKFVALGLILTGLAVAQRTAQT